MINPKPAQENILAFFYNQQQFINSQYYFTQMRNYIILQPKSYNGFRSQRFDLGNPKTVLTDPKFQRNSQDLNQNYIYLPLPLFLFPIILSPIITPLEFFLKQQILSFLNYQNFLTNHSTQDKNYNHIVSSMQSQCCVYESDEFFFSQDQNLVIREGLPTYLEIQKENKFSISGKSSLKLNSIFKEDAKNTGLDDSFGQQQEQGNQDSKSNSSYLPDLDPNPDCLLENQEFEFEEVAPLEQFKAQGEKKIFKTTRRKKKCRKTKREKSDTNSETKNIPKNYGKQIIKFIKHEKILTQDVLRHSKSGYTYQRLIQELKIKKKSLNKISDLRNLWLNNPYSKQIRILSGIFLRKYSLPWIFNSRVEKIRYPIKYRYRIIEGVRNPESFQYLKDY